MLPSSLNMIACGLLRRTFRRAALPEGLPTPVTLPSVFFRFSRTYMAVLALPRRQRPPRQAVPCRCLPFTRLSCAGAITGAFAGGGVGPWAAFSLACGERSWRDGGAAARSDCHGSQVRWPETERVVERFW